MKRGPQFNCQNEPSYSDHETVVFSIRHPDYFMDSDCNILKFEDLDNARS